MAHLSEDNGLKPRARVEVLKVEDRAVVALQPGERLLGDRGQARHDLEDEGLLHAAVVSPGAGEGEAGVALEEDCRHWRPVLTLSGAGQNKSTVQPQLYQLSA